MKRILIIVTIGIVLVNTGCRNIDILKSKVTSKSELAEESKLAEESDLVPIDTPKQRTEIELNLFYANGDIITAPTPKPLSKYVEVEYQIGITTANDVVKELGYPTKAHLAGDVISKRSILIFTYIYSDRSFTMYFEYSDITGKYHLAGILNYNNAPAGRIYNWVGGYSCYLMNIDYWSWFGVFTGRIKHMRHSKFEYWTWYGLVYLRGERLWIELNPSSETMDKVKIHSY